MSNTRDLIAPSEDADAQASPHGSRSLAPRGSFDPAERFRRSLAVVIGIDRYDSGIPALASATHDARAVAATLSSNHGFDTLELLNDEASLTNLLRLLCEQLPAELGDHDRLLFYFAGHGITLLGEQGPDGHLVPSDASRSDDHSFIPMRVLHRELDKLPVRHAFVILDCCYAGQYWRAAQRSIPERFTKLDSKHYNRYTDSAAWQLLTAASGDQVAIDNWVSIDHRSHDGHSPFTAALLDGLQGEADYTRDGLITAAELAMFIRNRVESTLEQSAISQSPQLFPLCRHDKGEFVFRVPSPN